MTPDRLTLDLAARPDRSALDVLLAGGGRSDRVVHVHDVPARPGDPVDWPSWTHRRVREGLSTAGVARPWSHQAVAAELAHQGRHTVVATGTASGKSLAFLLPVLSDLTAATDTPGSLPRPVTALYLSPTKALAEDQLGAVSRLDLPGVRAATYDGDTAPEERRWVRDHATYVLTNPDLLHHSLLPGHERWARFLRSLRYVVVDECHAYRGVFGSHVAAVLRRLRRVCERYGASPTFVLASATVADPATHAARLTGLPVEAVTEDGSPRGRTTFALWEPPLLPGLGEHDAPARRPASLESADLLADLVSAGVRSLAFVRSRRGVETVALAARRALADVDPDLPGRVAAYRGGYLPEERRVLERDLRSGELLGLAATNALELGIDVSGLDAVLVTGWPGTRASLWQQAGRAGRDGQDALAVLVAADDPLDTYLVHHPDALFGRPVEATVVDPENPHVLAPHLCAAAAELPLTPEGLEVFGPTAAGVVERLVTGGLLRRRPGGWYWTRPDRATDLADLRGTGGATYRVVEDATGRVLGTVDPVAAHRTVHAGAVYVHQGRSYVVDHLDLEQHVALVHREDPDWTTYARETSDVRILHTVRSTTWGPVELSFGHVEVSSQVVSFLRRRAGTGEVLGEEPLDLPVRTLRTAAVWWTVAAEVLEAAGVASPDLPGALHAAEHAAIGLLPLVATCDRWDVGGLSTAWHPDTGLPTVFVHDGHPGGAGFAERGYDVAASWLAATRDAVASCECPDGCPSCVQSPKCGNGNEPLDKRAAVRVLDAVLAGSPRQDVPGAPH